MKICHVTNVHPWNDKRVFRKECASLSKAGFDVYLVAPGSNRFENGVMVIGLGKEPRGRLKRMTTYARKAYRAALKVNAEVYHFHDPEMLPYAYKMKKQGYKVIFDSHENTLEYLSEKEYIPNALRIPLAQLFRNYAKRVLSKVDVIITVTPAIVEQMRPLNPHVVMVTNFPPLRELPRDVSHVSGRLCYTGSIVKTWCIKNIIDAIADIEGIEFYLCGAYDQSYVDSLKSSPGWSKCHFLGMISNEESIKLQQSSSLGMAMLGYTVFGFFKKGTLGNTKIYEYMMNGLPVICSDLDVWREMIDKYHCGLYVNPNDINAIKKAVLDIYCNPERLSEMGKNARRAVETEYNWSTQERILVDLYKSL